MVFAVILAGGSGSRMNSETTKQRMIIAGQSVIRRTVEVFDSCCDVDKIIVVARREEIEYMRAELSGICKLVAVVQGGATRAESSYRGLCAVEGACTLVAIHDAARCLITAAGISRVIAAAREHGAATAAAPVTDTLKLVGTDGAIIDTVDRRSIFAVQTPQVFECISLRAAFDSAPSRGAEITDDNMIYETAGGRVYTVDVGCDNFKITTPRDLLLAELGLKERSTV